MSDLSNPSSDPVSSRGSNSQETSNPNQSTTSSSQQSSLPPASWSSTSSSTHNGSSSTHNGAHRQHSAGTTNSIYQNPRFHPAQNLPPYPGIPPAIDVQPPPIYYGPPSRQPSHSTGTSSANSSVSTSVFMHGPPTPHPHKRINALESRLTSMERSMHTNVTNMQHIIQSNHQQILQMLASIQQPSPHHHQPQHQAPPPVPPPGTGTNATRQLFPPASSHNNNVTQPTAAATSVPQPTPAASPIPSNASPQRQQTTTPSTMMITPQIMHQAPKLKFEVLTNAMKDDHQQYESWRRGTIRKIIINPNTMTAVDPTTQNIELTIPPRTKMIIYDALEEALKPTAISTYLSTSQEIQTDVHSLFAALDGRYGKSSKTSISRLQSKSKFYNIGKRNNEKMETFFDRFKAAQEKAKCQTMDQQELATHYLSALGDNMFTQIILDINDGIRDNWWRNGLEKTHKKAVEHLESLKNPRINNPNDIRYYGRGNTAGSGNTNPNGNTRRNENGNAADRETDDPPPLGYKAQLKEWFPTTPTKAKLLAKSRQMNFKCNRHTHYRNQHSILQCNSYTIAANSLGWEEIWKAAKEHEERQRDGNAQPDGAPRVNRVTFDPTAQATDDTNNQQPSENNNSTNDRVNSYICAARRSTNSSPIPSSPTSPNITPLSTPDPPVTKPTTSAPLSQSQSKKTTTRKWHFFPPKTPKVRLNTLHTASIPLPLPSTSEINYLNHTNACWDVVEKKPSPSTEVAIPDSGCKHHISHNIDDFIDIQRFESTDRPFVKMADDNTQLHIHGYGTIALDLDGNTVHLSALYVPDMCTRLLSISQHIQYSGCTFFTANNNAILTFPTFYIDIINGEEFQIPVRSATSATNIRFDETAAELCPTTEGIQQCFNTTTPSPFLCPTDHYSTATAKFKKLHNQATLPIRSTSGSAAIDISSIENVTIQPSVTKTIRTGLATAFSPDLYLRIAPRSSHALKSIFVNGGVIDSNYRGEIKIILFNASKTPFTIKTGDRIAQGIFEKHATPQLILADDLDSTERGKGGFGSTGANRIQLCQVDDNTTIQIDRTRGPTKLRARRVNKTIQDHISLLRNTSLPHSPNTASTTQNQNPKATNQSHFTDNELSVQFEMETDDVESHDDKENFSSWMEPIEDPNSISQTPDTNTDDDAEEIYSDYQTDYRLPTSRQRSTPATTAPEDTNLEPHGAPPLATTTTQDSLPNRHIKDKPNSSLPQKLNITRDRLLQSIGHINPDKLIKLLPQLVKEDTIHIQMDSNPRIDLGEHATLSNTKRSKKAVPLPEKYGDVWHIDIGFGPSKAIGGARYCLFFVDRKTRYKHVFPLKNLKDDLLLTMRKFITKVKRQNIGEFYTDFDEKIIGGDVKKLLDEEHINITAAPPRRQSENGLVENHWKQIVKMARNWLRSNLLPSNFWWFAIKRATEVCNSILPTYHADKKHPKTPYELVYKEKPDPRNLIPLFSIADIKVERETGGSHRNKFKSQTLRCITVGLSHKSDCVMFYHPPSKQLIHSPNYKFDTYLPSGPQFALAFDGDFVFNTRTDLENSQHRPTNTKVYVTINATTQRGTIIDTPINENTDPYYVQLDNNDIIEVMSSDISESDPNANPSDIPIQSTDPPHLPWIKNGAKVTMVPPGTSTPKQGYLRHSTTIPGEWEFILGRKKTNPALRLPHFESNIHSLIENKKLFKGWKNLRLASSARLIKGISNLYCRHISAKDLTIMKAPSLLKHHTLPEPDRTLWDQSYAEEYNGLKQLGTWREVSPEEYESLKSVIKAKFLPTMAISTIKYDRDGNPKRCKCRIVALGNLDPHNWSKQDCFAPVLSQMEHRTLLALATRLKCTPKTGDVSQAFCQGVLPSDEEYYIKPPPGCPLTTKGGYLKLLKTLYGLKRSPRHWYEKARATLLSIGFKQCPNAPCLFIGHLLKGEPPVYLGLYVDDFVYFSQSRKAEIEFETRFSAKISVDFNGTIGYFLGINHTVEHHADGHITIHLSQEAFIDALLLQHLLHHDHVATERSPYKSGLPVDKIKNTDYSHTKQQYLTQKFQSIVGSLNWLATSTRPDIAPITNILAKYLSNPSEGHLAHAKHVLRYLKGAKTYGISFSSRDNDNLQSFLKFPIPSDRVTALTDANWGPQDQSKPHPSATVELELFKTRSLSGYLIWFGGPLHWSAKQQGITARSSAEAEIYATDECVKQLQYLHNILEDLDVLSLVMPDTTQVYNDNTACVCWSKSMTTKGLRHIQIRQNAVREAVQSKLVEVNHIEGAINLADLFTKEQKDVHHFLLLRNTIMTNMENTHKNNEKTTNIANNKEEGVSSPQMATQGLTAQGGDNGL